VDLYCILAGYMLFENLHVKIKHKKYGVKEEKKMENRIIKCNKKLERKVYVRNMLGFLEKKGKS